MSSFTLEHALGLLAVATMLPVALGLLLALIVATVRGVR